MKTVSKVAFAAALMTGASGLLIGSAQARKDKGPVETFALSSDVRAAAVAAKAALTAGDLTTAQTDIARIESTAGSDDERYVGAQLRLQLEYARLALPGGVRNDAAFAKPLDFLINYPRTPKAALPGYVYARANIFYNSRQFPRAAVYYGRARDLGYKVDDLDLVGRSKMDSGDLKGGAIEFEAAINAETAAGRKPPEAWYRFTIARFYKANLRAEAAAWTGKWLQAYGGKENWHDAIVTLGFQGEGLKRLNDRQRLELFRLMRATGSLGGQGDYTAYADSALKLEVPAEAKSVIEEGRTAGALPAKDAQSVALMTKANAALKTRKAPVALEKTAAAAASGAPAAEAGDAYLGQRDYAKAAALYDSAITKGVGNADDVTLDRGIALALAGNRDQAGAAFDAITTAPDNEIATLWKASLNAAPAS